jgi:hypothetical protein
MALTELITKLYNQGLGELLILHTKQNEVCLGHLIYEKDKLILKDEKLLAEMKPSQLLPCWESGLLGMVCSSEGQTWESLSFYGLEHCDLPVDLGKTRHGALVAAQNQYGESLINFKGSVYRGYQLMLDHHFLPVVLMKIIRSKTGDVGLAVSDLRTVPMSISMIHMLNDIARSSVEKRLTLNVEDSQVSQDEFEKLFGDYLTKS